MKMTFRWYGTNDVISLAHIKQIPGISGVVSSLVDIPVGEVWQKKDIKNLQDEVHAHGLRLEIIESVNVHEDIKLGLPSRDKYIKNYKETLKNLSEFGIETVCYNFMPIFDWTRTELAKELPDKSTVLSFDYEQLKDLSAKELIERIKKDSNGMDLPGWENERLDKIEGLFKAYEKVDEEQLWKNLEYFLKEIIPYAKTATLKWQYIQMILLLVFLDFQEL